MNRETYTQIANNYDDLIHCIVRAISYYSRKAREAGLSNMTYSSYVNVTGVTEVYDGAVEVDWDETWSYGGYDKGSYSIPSEMLFDDTYESFIDSMIKDEKDRETKLAKEKLEQDRACREKEELEVLAKLKAKYES